MYKIRDPGDILGNGNILVFVPFSTQRKDGIPSIPDSLILEIPNARRTFEKIGSRDTYYYMGNGNTYIFHRVKTSTKASLVSTEMLNKGLDILEEEFPLSEIVLILGTGETTSDEYIKLLFKTNNAVYFVERN